MRGLSRSDASDAKLRALGATPHRGALDQSASYQRSAAAHDALLHIAFDYVYGGTAIGYIKRAGCSSTQDIRRWRP